MMLVIVINEAGYGAVIAINIKQGNGIPYVYAVVCVKIVNPISKAVNILSKMYPL